MVRRVGLVENRRLGGTHRLHLQGDVGSYNSHMA
jgi:hypothetical protein